MPTKSVPKKWMSYEEVATYLLDEVAHHFGLGRVEKKKMVAGHSGTDWELDATGWSKDGTKFFAIECKMHTKTGISQAITAHSLGRFETQAQLAAFWFRHSASSRAPRRSLRMPES